MKKEFFDSVTGFEAPEVLIRPGMPRLTMRKGTSQDMNSLRYFRQDAGEWLAAKGSDQWQSPYPKEVEDQVWKNLYEGNTWIGRDTDGRHICTITGTTKADSTLWNDAERKEPAFYISKLSVLRKYAGLGIGSTLLGWADKKAQSLGCGWLRLDCWSTNEKLQEYYRNQGFSYLRTVPDRPSGALFQREVFEAGYDLRH